jgi:toxin ParE1/3/4
MIPYAISLRAQTDLDEIWSFIARDNIPAADRMMDLFAEKFLLFASQPLLGEKREELQVNLRSFCVGNYVTFYRPLPNKIQIIRVLHSARDIEAQF